MLLHGTRYHFVSQNLILRTSTIFLYISSNKNHIQTTSQDKHTKKANTIDKNQFQINYLTWIESENLISFLAPISSLLRMTFEIVIAQVDKAQLKVARINHSRHLE